MRVGASVLSIVFLCAVGAEIPAVSAKAADLPVRVPVHKAASVAPAAAYDWTGFFVGLNAGGGWSQGAGANPVSGDSLPNGFQQAISSGLVPTHFDINYSGFIGGAQAGYNRQWNSLVLGIEADLDYTNFNGSNTYLPPNPALVGFTSVITNQHIDWFGTARARFGYTPADRVLVFGTGGLAFAQLTSKSLAPERFGPDFFGKDSTTKAGWTIGGGLEYSLGQRWSAKIEYLYYDLGKTTVVATSSPFFAVIENQYSGHIARVGVNYALGGPAVAKN